MVLMTKAQVQHLLPARRTPPIRAWFFSQPRILMETTAFCSKSSLQHKLSQTSDANEERLPQVASSFLINMKRPLFQAVVVSQTDGIMLRTIHFVSLQKFVSVLESKQSKSCVLIS